MLLIVCLFSRFVDLRTSSHDGLHRLWVQSNIRNMCFYDSEKMIKQVLFAAYLYSQRGSIELIQKHLPYLSEIHLQII